MITLWLAFSAHAATLDTVPHWSELLFYHGHEVLAGDADLDGDEDLVVSTTDWDGQAWVTRYLNDGTGAFTAAGQVTFPAYISTMLFEDLDGDGDRDLVLDSTCHDDADQLRRWYTNTGAFLLKHWEKYGCDNVEDLAAGDFDGDGDLDVIAATSAYSDGWGATPDADLGLQNRGTRLGRFEGPEAYSFGVDVGDWDNDGVLEVVFARGGDQYAHVSDGAPDAVYSAGPGGFVLEWESLESESSASVRWGDYDADGDLDLAVGGGGGAHDKVYENTGGALVLAHVLPKASPDYNVTRTVDWADYDADGDLDLLLAHDHVVKVYANEPAGFVEVWSIVGASGFSTQPSARWVDVDGDGDPDVAANGDTHVEVYLNN